MNKGSSPDVDRKWQQKQSTNTKQPTQCTITFSELPNRIYGNLRLIYFSQSEDNVQSVLGISEPFSIRKKP